MPTMIDEPVSAAACAFIRIGYISELGDLKDCNAIIIATCIPGLRPFIKFLRQKYFSRKPRHRPPPLNLHKDVHIASDGSALSTPISARRMEPRSSGSVSSPVLKAPNHKAYRQKSLAPILSNNVDDVDFEGFEMKKEVNDVEKRRLDSGLGAEKEVRQNSKVETSVETSSMNGDVPPKGRDGDVTGSG
ncbi:MAG: hypothetical protein LQ352_004696 [Teloschistes flavicans]|nr:MAG: hypothetical protein LQ352_004696 [Teloschistes flavicans]